MTKLPNRKWELTGFCYCGRCRYTGKRDCPEKGLGKKGTALYSSREWPEDEFRAAQDVLKRLKP